MLYAQTGEPEFLDSAAVSARQALELTPAGSGDLMGYRSNLGSVLLDRYHAAGHVADLDEAISLFSEGVADAPAQRSSYEYLYAINLGTTLMLRYRLTGDLDTGFRAVAVYEKALKHTPRKTGFGYESGWATSVPR